MNRKPSRFAVRRVREMALRCEISRGAEHAGVIANVAKAAAARQNHSESAFLIAGLYRQRHQPTPST